jgi:colicin import membrane protein
MNAENTELAQVTHAVAEFDRVAAGIQALQKQYGGMVYDVTKTAGMADAKDARLAVREPRFEVEKIRKGAKAPLLALGKKLDSEAARITGELLKIEKPIHEQIVNEEERKETERQAKVDAEIKRVADIQERIGEFRGVLAAASGSAPALILEHLGDIERIPVDDTFEEFRQQAEDAKISTLAQLRQMHAAAVDAEAEKARVKAEREELARLRAADEARQAAERARIAEEDRISREARKAEAARVAEENRLERERIAAERAESDRVDSERREGAAAEQRRLDDQRAAFEREQAEARRISQEAEDRRLADAAAAKKTKYPGDAAIIKALAKHFDVSEKVVRGWLQQVRAAA